jgi:ferredoxin-type protein NapG
MADQHIDDLPPHDRRRFFAAGLSRVLRPLADYLEQRLPAKLADLAAAAPPLRPPGARPEREFLETCFRCGSCADACPAKAIALTESINEDQVGTPYIDPDAAACVICDDLACMKACPSGALKLVDRFDIRIGLAAVDHHLCVRSSGVECTDCLDHCPLGETAIRLLPNGRVQVINPAPTGQGCTGCGLCQQHCPTNPVKAIRVLPY